MTLRVCCCRRPASRDGERRCWLVEILLSIPVACRPAATRPRSPSSETPGCPRSSATSGRDRRSVSSRTRWSPGQVDGSAASSETPWPCGPRNCGQLPAWTVTPRASGKRSGDGCRSGLIGGPRLSSEALILSASHLCASLLPERPSRPAPARGPRRRSRWSWLSGRRSRRQRLARVARRSHARRPLHREEPAVEVVAASEAPAGENVAWRCRSAAARRRSCSAIASISTAPSAISPSPGAPGRRRRGDRQGGLGAPLQRLSERRAAAPRGWASPAVDPATGNIYMFGGAPQLFALSPDGKVLWDRSLPEEYGAVTTHGGRTTSPIVEGDKVILNTLISAWGDSRPRRQSLLRVRQEDRPDDVGQRRRRRSTTTRTTRRRSSRPSTAAPRSWSAAPTACSTRLKATPARRSWSLEVSKRAILNSAWCCSATVVYRTHGEENIDTTEMGMIAAHRRHAQGVLTAGASKWIDARFLPTFASPVMDEHAGSVHRGQQRDRAALRSEDRQGAVGESLGTLQKGSPVLADGKLYVGTENGKFYILRPSATGVEVLDEDAAQSSTRHRDAEPGPERSSRRRSSPTAACTSRRWTRSTPSARRR